MASSSEASCISDPNFAVICAFLERFAKSCGITYPTFMDLQEMLENVEQVPQQLIDLHIKLLRKARKTVFIEKWERALVKFCHTYSNQDGWEIERFGYKKSRLEVKLRVLKMLLEGQFDLNNKFKASINTLEADELRSKPLGKDKLGRVYWLQSDPISNIRVYREDLDEESWTLVAKDRASMVELLQELSGEEFPLDMNLLNEDSTSLDVKPVMDTGQSNGSIKVENSCNNHDGNVDSKLPEAVLNSAEVPQCTKNVATESKTKGNESKDLEVPSFESCEKGDGEGEQNDKEGTLDQNGTEIIKEAVIVGEAIEEPVMYVVGEGNGEDCNTGNPEKEEKNQEECGGDLGSGQIEVDESAQNSSESDLPPSINTEKLKPAPKLWSIDTICGVNSNLEVSETNKQEQTDIKVKHKNFSSFSIDSVLEKRDLGGATTEGCVSKFECSDLGDSLSETLHSARTDSCLEDSSRKLLPGANSDSELNPLGKISNFSHAVHSKTENLTSKNENLEPNSDKKEPACCETVPEDKDENACENVSDITFPNKKEGNKLKIKTVNEEKEISVSEVHDSDVIEKSEANLANQQKEHSSGEQRSAHDESKNGMEVLKEIDLKVSHEITKENVERTSVDIVEVSETPKNSDSKKTVSPNEKEKEETLKISEDVINKADNLTGDSEKVGEYVEEIDEESSSKWHKDEETGTKAGHLPQSKSEESVKTNKSADEGGKADIVSSEKGVVGPRVSQDIVMEDTSRPEDTKMVESKRILQTIEPKDVKADNTERKVDESKYGPKMCSEEQTDKTGEEDEAIVASEGLIAGKGKNAELEKSSVVQLAESSHLKDDGTTKNLDSENEKKVCSVESETGSTREASNTSNKTVQKSETPEEMIGRESEKSGAVEVETQRVVVENKPIKSRKKEILPQRVLSRNRVTTEGSNQVPVKESNKLRGRKKRGKKCNVNEKQETKTESEKGKEDEGVKGKGDGSSEGEEGIRNEENHEKSQAAVEEKTEKEGEEEVAKTKARRGRKRRRRWKRNVSKESTDKQEKEAKQESPSISALKQEDEKEGGAIKRKGRPKKEATTNRSGSRQIPSREIKLLGITETETELPSIRQSRRIAQLKLKEEAERRRIEALQLESFKGKKSKKASKSGKRKSKQNADSDSYEEKNDDDEDSDEVKEKKDKKKRRKKKDKLKFNELNPWLSSSGSSTVDDEEDEIEDEAHEDEELIFKSDHEFSPESDIEDPDYKPIKRARTAKVEESKDEAGKYDDTSCEKCGNNDHPEWILLCDKCDKGWHASCVRPALMVVPEGDWFCPPCEHVALITKLQESLTNYDRCQKQRENEELRRKRLAFVGISLDNVLPLAKSKSSKHEDGETNKEDEEELGSSESHSDSDSESSISDADSGDSSEPVYQLRERRSNVTSYRYNEYDELIKSALQDEIEAVKGAGNAGRGKDINNIVNAERQTKERAENISENAGGDAEKAQGVDTNNLEEKIEKCREKGKRDDDYEMDTEGDEDEEEDENLVDELPPVVPKSVNKKKSKSVKITSLDFTSEEEDNNSDSDFKGTSSEEESDYSLPSESETSDGIGKKRRGDGPVRRSTRARVSRYDRDFINDESESDEPRRKKNRRPWDSSESSDSDRSWGRRKRKANKSSSGKSKGSSNIKKKKKKQKKRASDSDEDSGVSPRRPKNKKIKYGGLESPDEDKVLTRRTRGKKINYQEMNGSDSEEDGRQRKSRPGRIIESDDDFVAKNEKDDMQDKDSEEMESGADEEEEGGTKERQNNNKMRILEKMKKKKWVIPDPDDFSENDLMEDKQLDEFAEEMEDLDEEEEEILGNILESGDVPIQELRAAVRRAKEERKLRAEEQNKNKDSTEKDPAETTIKAVPAIPAHMEFPGGGKFPKIGKMKITPSRAELASQILSGVRFSSMTGVGVPVNSGRFVPQEKAVEGQDTNQTKEKEIEAGGVGSMGSGFLLRTLQSDPKAGTLGDVNIPPNHSVQNDAQVQGQGPFAAYPVETAPVGPLNMMAMMNAMTQGGAGGNGGNPGAISMSASNGRPLGQFGTFQGIGPPPSGLPAYPATIPTTVTGISNLDPQSLSQKKQVAKPGSTTKRKMEDLSPQMDESSESGDLCYPLQQGEELARVKGLQDSPPKKKGRGRGKKQLLAEAQAQVQAQAQGKQDLTAVQGPAQFPSPEGGSVITRMLNTPQTFPQNESNQFPGGPRNPPPFRPQLPPHFGNSPRSPAPIRLRVPVQAPSTTMFHTSHPLDPSPSGGGAINIPCTSGGLTKTSPPSPPFRPPGGQIMPRFAADPTTVRHVFPTTGSPPRPEFSAFPGFYGNFPPSAASLPGGEEPSFQGPPFPEQFAEGLAPAGGASKPFEDETGGEFGGLASYFASQREDDLDT